MLLAVCCCSYSSLRAGRYFRPRRKGPLVNYLGGFYVCDVCGTEGVSRARSFTDNGFFPSTVEL
jgi:hypothetical protein